MELIKWHITAFYPVNSIFYNLGFIFHTFGHSLVKITIHKVITESWEDSDVATKPTAYQYYTI